MRNILYLGIIVSVFMLFGCGKATIEDVAKDHVKKQLNLDKGVKLDISKLQYTVTKKEGDTATVKVAGTINYEEQIFLVKDGRKWRIEEKKAEQVKQPEQPKKTEPEEPHPVH